MTQFSCKIHGNQNATLVCMHLTDNIGLRAVANWDEQHERWDLLCESCAADGDPGDLEAVCDICQLFYARGQIFTGYNGPRPPSFASEWEHMSAEEQLRTKEAITRARLKNLTEGTERSEDAIKRLPVVAHRIGGRLAVHILEALQIILRKQRDEIVIKAVSAFLINSDPNIVKRAGALLESVDWEFKKKLRGGIHIRPKSGEWQKIESPEEPLPMDEQIKE